MAKSGFLISPLVENTKEFALLFGNPDHLSDQRVKSLRISPDGHSSIFWNSKYTLKLSKLEIRTDSDITKLIKIDTLQEKISEGADNSPAENCDGAIDTVNGITPAPSSIKTANFLSIAGWLAVSAKDAVVPDTVFVTLTDRQGNTSYLKTRSTPRTDVKVYFKQPGMPDVGYEMSMDVSKFKGDFVIGLARVYKGKLGHCPQFNLPVLIER